MIHMAQKDEDITIPSGCSALIFREVGAEGGRMNIEIAVMLPHVGEDDKAPAVSVTAAALGEWLRSNADYAREIVETFAMMIAMEASGEENGITN
jgi:hypothetical protein